MVFNEACEQSHIMKLYVLKAMFYSIHGSRDMITCWWIIGLSFQKTVMPLPSRDKGLNTENLHNKGTVVLRYGRKY
jgi:hypothetical protein